MGPEGIGLADELAQWFEKLPDLEMTLEAKRQLAQRNRHQELRRRAVVHRKQVEAIRAAASRLEDWADGAGIRRHALHGARYGDRMPLRIFEDGAEPPASLELGWAAGGESKAHLSGVSESLSAPQLSAIADYLASDEPWRDLQAFICERLGIDAPSD